MVLFILTLKGPYKLVVFQTIHTEYSSYQCQFIGMSWDGKAMHHPQKRLFEWRQVCASVSRDKLAIDKYVPVYHETSLP